MNAEDLLERVAATLKRDIGPAVEAEYPRSQAYLAAVVLHKLARQQRLAATHAAADRSDRQRLVADLERLLAASEGVSVLHADFDNLREIGDDAALAAFVSALYAKRATLGEALFTALLGRVRQTLRARLDRQLAYCA